MFQRVGEETKKASEAKSDLTNGMTSKALVEDLNVLTGYKLSQKSEFIKAF